MAVAHAFGPDGDVARQQLGFAANLDQDRAFDRNAKIWFRWVAKYHSRYHLGSTEKAERLLGFSATVPLEEGLESVIAWRRRDQRVATGS